MPKSPVCRQDATLPHKRHQRTRTHYFLYFAVFQGSYVGLNQPPSQEGPSLPRAAPSVVPQCIRTAREGTALCAEGAHAGLDPSGSDSRRTPGRPLTLVKFIQTGGVAEGTDGSRLPAAPTLHPHSGTALAEATRYMAVSFTMEKKERKKKKELKAKENVLIPQPAGQLHRCTYSSTFHIINSRHMLLAEHYGTGSQQPSNHPLTGMHHRASLNSISARNRHHPPQKKGQKKDNISSYRGEVLLGLSPEQRSTSCRIFSPKTKRMQFWVGRMIFGSLSL